MIYRLPMICRAPEGEAGGGMPEMVVLDGQAFSLADLANLGFNDVQAVKTTRLPRGSFLFTIEDTAFTTREAEDQETNEKYKALVIPIKCKVEKCFGAIGNPGEPDIDPDSLIGKTHTETFWCRTTEAYGRFKQFCLDIGYAPAAGTNPGFQEIVMQLKGYRFSAPISHAKNKKDADMPHVNIRLDKVKTAPVEQIPA